MNKYNDEYLNLLLKTKMLINSKSDNSNIKLSNELIDLIYKMSPTNKSLYRYRPMNKNNIDALINDRLYFSTPNNYSDIYDSLFTINFKSNFDQIDYAAEMINKSVEDNDNILKLLENTIYSSQLNKINLTNTHPKKEEIVNAKELIKSFVLDSFAKDMTGIKSQIKSICFTEKFDDLKMWDQYGGGYKGFCLEYDISNVSQSKTDINTISSLFPIAYSDIPYDFSETYFPLLYNKTFHFDLDYDWFGFFKTQLIKNKEHYSMENEWRLLDLNQEVKYITIKPKAIYLGPALEDSDIQLLYNIAKEKNIPIYKLYIDFYNPTYNLNYKLIEKL